MRRYHVGRAWISATLSRSEELIPCSLHAPGDADADRQTALDHAERAREAIDGAYNLKPSSVTRTEPSIVPDETTLALLARAPMEIGKARGLEPYLPGCAEASGGGAAGVTTIEPGWKMTCGGRAAGGAGGSRRAR